MVVYEKGELEVSWKVHWRKYAHLGKENWVHQ